MNLTIWSWKIISWFLPGKKIPIPKNTLIFREMPQKELLEGLVRAFQVIYSMPPWNEDWLPRKVEDKLRQELQEGILVLLLKEPYEVVGFSWGAVISPTAIIPRIVASFPKDTKEPSEGLEYLISRLPKKFFYWDEIALLPKAQTGLKPLRWLTLSVLQFAREKGVKSVLFRTTSGSKVVRLARFMGFRKVFARRVGGVEEIYLYLEDLEPFLKIAEVADIRKVVMVMKLLARFLKTRS